MKRFAFFVFQSLDLRSTIFRLKIYKSLRSAERNVFGIPKIYLLKGLDLFHFLVVPFLVPVFSIFHSVFGFSSLVSFFFWSFLSSVLLAFSCCFDQTELSQNNKGKQGGEKTKGRGRQNKKGKMKETTTAKTRDQKNDNFVFLPVCLLCCQTCPSKCTQILEN